MAHENKAVGEFVKDIKKGDYVIPHFQRDFDWRPNMTADLFKSILHDYYAGTILLWNLEDKDRELKMWDPLWGSKKNDKPTKAILDGQQRLSSIYYALFAPLKKFPNRATYYYFFVNLDALFSGNEDESIDYWYYWKYRTVSYFKERRQRFIEKGYFPLCLLSDSIFMSGRDYEDWVNDYVKSRQENKTLNLTSFRVTRRIEGILKYAFLTETLERKELKEICTIFANINSKGLRLSIFDLMNAFLYPHGIHLRKRWEESNNEKLKEVDSDMKVYLLKLMSLYKQKYCSSKFLYNLIPGSTVKDRSGSKTVLIKDKTEFINLWNDATKYAEKARKKIMNTGKDDFGAIKNNFIPNTTIVPVLGALIFHYEKNLKGKLSESEFYTKIRKWYWCAVLSQDYSGSSDSIMAKDHEDVKNWLEDDTQIPERIQGITSSFIEDSINFLKAKNTNNSQYSAVLNILALNSSKDFFTGRIIGTYPVSEIHDHHIFPKKSGLKIASEKVDSILNRTLIYDETNKKISNKKPSEYYKEIVKKNGGNVEKVLKTHLISEKALSFMIKDKFEDFIREREATIKSELKRILNISSPEDTSLIAPGKEYDNEIKYVSYIEDSINYLHIIDPYFRENSLRLIRKGLKNNKSIEQIKIITKPDALDEDFKSSFKKFAKQMKQEGIRVEMRVLVEPKFKAQLHNRYLITKNKSYNFVSADTVSRGQLSHIKEIADLSPIFDDFWKKGIDLINQWDKISGSH